MRRGHDEARVEQRVRPVRDHPSHERRVVDAVHHDEQLVERHAAPATHAAREHEAVEAHQARGEAALADGRRLAAVEELVAPGPRLEDQVARRVERAPGAVEEVLVEARGRQRRDVDRSAEAPGTAAKRLAAHPDGVDLVDEDDARAAPLARGPLGLPGEVAHDDRVDPDEGRGEAGARDRDERRVEAGRERLREHRLARAGRPEEQHAALALAAVALELLARLPDRDDAAHLLLRLGLSANVVELDAPLRVAGLERLDLREVHREQRAEQDPEVRDEEEEDEDDLDPQGRRREDVADPVEDEADRAPPRAAAEQPDDRDHDDEDHGDLEPEAPEPGATAADDVLLAELAALDAEQARRRDQPAEEQVGEAAEDDDDRRPWRGAPSTRPSRFAA